MPLERDDLRHLTVAQGYVKLVMHLEADAGLKRIDPDVRHVPEVLALRLEIYSGLKKWDLMQAVAKKLAQCDPENAQWRISWAYATRRAESIDAARLILVNALEACGTEPIIHFNLACYECQIGNLEEARRRLQRAFALNPALKVLALEEEDLAPLRDSMDPQF